RPQSDPPLPTGHPSGAETPVPQADRCLPVPQPAHAAVSAHRPGRAPDSPRGSERAAPHRELGDGVALWAYRSTAGRLIYLPIGVSPRCPSPNPRPADNRLIFQLGSADNLVS